MDRELKFSYHYSAGESREVEEIRRKYLPREESKLEELKRLDKTVQSAGIPEGLGTGIGGALVFGLGMCFSMKVIGGSGLWMALGAVFGLLGAGGMLAAYPIYRKVFEKARRKYTPRILALAAELSNL